MMEASASGVGRRGERLAPQVAVLVLEPAATRTGMVATDFGKLAHPTHLPARTVWDRAAHLPSTGRVLFQTWFSLLPLRALRLQLSRDSAEQLIKVRIDDFPDQLQVESSVSMGGDVPETEDLSPGNFRMALPQFIREVVARGVRNRLKPPGHHVLKDLVQKEGIQPGRLVAPDTQNAIADVIEVPLFAVGQIGTASAAIAAAARLPSSITRSIRRPSASSKSVASSVRSRAPRPGSMSSRRSLSLSGRESPRAAETNTRAFLAPCNATSGTIASRRSLRALSVGRPNISALLISFVRRRLSTARLCTRSPPSTWAPSRTFALTTWCILALDI